MSVFIKRKDIITKEADRIYKEIIENKNNLDKVYELLFELFKLKYNEPCEFINCVLKLDSCKEASEIIAPLLLDDDSIRTKKHVEMVKRFKAEYKQL